jgi:hypothetical protein
MKSGSTESIWVALFAAKSLLARAPIYGIGETAGRDALDGIVTQVQVVEASFFLQRQQRKALLERAGKHAHAVALRHGMPVVDLDTEQARRGGILLLRLDSNDKAR